MDTVRFDELARALSIAARRRTGRRPLVTAALAALFGAGAVPAAAACIENGGDCDPKKPQQCCSGTCKKKARGHKCKPTPGAEGCTVRDDACTLPESRECPGNPDGFCIVLDSGKPYCFLGGICADCETDADCDKAFGAEGGKCVIRCRTCREGMGSSRSACVFPEPIEVVVEARSAGSRRGLLR